MKQCTGMHSYFTNETHLEKKTTDIISEIENNLLQLIYRNYLVRIIMGSVHNKLEQQKFTSQNIEAYIQYKAFVMDFSHEN